MVNGNSSACARIQYTPTGYAVAGFHFVCIMEALRVVRSLNRELRAVRS